MAEVQPLNEQSLTWKSPNLVIHVEPEKVVVASYEEVSEWSHERRKHYPVSTRSWYEIREYSNDSEQADWKVSFGWGFAGYRKLATFKGRIVGLRRECKRLGIPYFRDFPPVPVELTGLITARENTNCQIYSTYHLWRKQGPAWERLCLPGVDTRPNLYLSWLLPPKDTPYEVCGLCRAVLERCGDGL